MTKASSTRVRRSRPSVPVTAAAPAVAAGVIEPRVVILDEPVVRGSMTITDVVVRKPKAGALRGLSVKQLINGDTDQLLVVLPRITDLTAPEVANLEPADLVQFAAEVMDFLLPKATKASLGL